MIYPKVTLQSPHIIDQNYQTEDLLNLLLKNRSINERPAAFLNPPFPKLPLRNLKLVGQRIKKAILHHQKILIYGDYDADGLTATAILWQTLNGLGAEVTPFIPNRETDGYGFKYQSFKNFESQKNTKFNLVITVDNGIVASNEFKKLKNIDVVIIDHHLASSVKPKTKYIIHSTATSASTLAWFLANSFDKNADLGLAALGVVADCLPVTGINRSVIVHGLRQINTNPTFGLKKLIDVSSLKQGNITAYDFGFILAPRLNAVGRLADPTDALRLLCSQNSLQASKYSTMLNQHNRDRQTLQKDSLKTAEKLYQDTLRHSGLSRIIFLSDPSFHPGIIGLIAGRLTEKYYLPSIIIAQNSDISKGSCRSIPELNIINTLRQLSNLFIDLGGHPAAAGFSLKTKNIEKFQKEITKIINLKLSKKDLKPTIFVDAQMKLSAVNLKNTKAIEKLSPFGIGNNKPLFLFKNLKVVSKRVLGSTGDHLKLKLDDPTTSRLENIVTDAIAFKKGELDKSLKIGDLVDIVASLDANTWNGTTTPQLVVKEIIKI